MAQPQSQAAQQPNSRSPWLKWTRMDYEQSDQWDLALRSRLSAASCFWRAGQPDQARELFEAMIQEHPTQEQAIREVVASLEHDYPKPSSSV